MITRSKANKKASFNAKALSASPTDGYATWGKRLFDIAFATSVLLVFSPVYILIALIVAASSRGSILYIHERVGLNHQPFKCIKFRTMIAQADQVLEEYLNSCPVSRAEYEASFKLRHDPRITKIGRFLRKTSLDELPQFWNVLVGDMSVVGPRPLVHAELIKYGNEIDKVLSVRPGIAGLWQVSGRNDVPYAQRIKLDASYVRRMSFSLDLQLIFKTFLVVIFPKNNGAY